MGRPPLTRPLSGDEIDVAFDALSDGFAQIIVETYGDPETGKLDFDKIAHLGGVWGATELLTARSARQIDRHSKVLVELTKRLERLTWVLIGATLVLVVLTGALLTYGR